MKSKQAKQAFQSKEMSAGTLTGNEPWVLSPDLVTTAPLTNISTKYDNSFLQSAPSTISFFNSNNNKEAADGSSLSFHQEVTSKTGFVTRRNHNGTDNHQSFLRVVQQCQGTGLNGYYLYRTTPAFEGQTAANPDEFDAETSDGDSSDSDDDDESDKKKKNVKKDKALELPSEPLYVYARMLHIPKKDSQKTTAYVVYSVVKGINPDAQESGLGFAWRDVYKLVRVPQFQFAAIGFEILGGSTKMVLKATQQNAAQVRPKFEVTANVDLTAVVLACFPLFPDGTVVLDGIETAVDVGSLMFGIV